MDAGTQNWVLQKSNKYSKPLSHLQPQDLRGVGGSTRAHEYKYALEARSFLSAGPEITGSYALSKMGAGIQTRVFCESTSS